MIFSDFLAAQSGAAAPPGGQNVAYTQDRATYRDKTIGAISQTGNPLDLALSGDGYFTVQTANGVRLTRDGHFQLGGGGTITDQNGNALLDDNGRPLQLSTTDVNPTIAGDGTISSSNGTIGKVAVVIPNDSTQLQAEGNTLLNATGGTTPATTPKMIQGAIEQSNVEPITETTAMMSDLREFQFVTQLLDAENTRQQDAIDKIAAPAST
jgi:flagellar basal-body rod protein FlgF